MGTTPDRQYGRELATEAELTQRLSEHRDRTLLHAFDRNAVMDVTRDANGRVLFIRHRDGAGGPAIREMELGRDTQGRVLTVTERQFEPPGTLARTLMLTLARGGDSKVSGGTLAAG